MPRELRRLTCTPLFKLRLQIQNNFAPPSGQLATSGWMENDRLVMTFDPEKTPYPRLTRRSSCGAISLPCGAIKTQKLYKEPSFPQRNSEVCAFWLWHCKLVVSIETEVQLCPPNDFVDSRRSRDSWWPCLVLFIGQTPNVPCRAAA